MSFRHIALAVMLTTTAMYAVGTDYKYTITRAPSEAAPVSNPPQLIVLGSDDNTSAEGMNWILDYLASKKHKDGSALRMSFYSNTAKWGSNSSIVDAHKKAYAAKHEVSNHTDSHIYCVIGEKAKGNQTRLGVSNIETEIQKATDALVAAGVAPETMKGFRTPYLAYSDSTFTAVKNKGFTYDCSINEGVGWGDAIGNAIGKYVWPYTLDTQNSNDASNSYAPGNNVTFAYWNQTYDAPIRQHSGLWELPCYMYVAPQSVHDHMSTLVKYDHGGKITGLDYNMWARPGGGWMLNKDQSIATLKNTLDQMLAGNRTPMTVGMHSQYYVEYPEDTAFVNIQSAADRKAVLEQFIDYALTKDNVWFVSGAQAIAFCINPVSASNFKPDDYLPSVNTSENVAPTGINLSNNSVEEGVLTVGTLSSVDANSSDTHTYSVVTGGDKFEVTGNTLKLKASVAVGDYTVKIKTTDNGGKSFEKDITVKVTAKVVVGDAYEVIGVHTWSGSSDELKTGSKAEISGTSPVTLKLTKGTDVVNGTNTDYAWVSATAYLDTNMEKVSQIEISYSSDKDFALGLSSDAYGYTAALTKGTDVTKVLKISDFTKSWGSVTAIKLADISGPAIEATESGTTEVTVKSLKLYGYVKPGGSTGTNSDTISIVGSKTFGFYDYHDSATVGDTSYTKSSASNVEILLQRAEDKTYPGAGIWGPDGFTMDKVVSIELTYTSDVDFEINLPMKGAPTTVASHARILEASSTAKTVNLNVGSFTQSWGDQTTLVLKDVEGFGLSLPNSVLKGTINITSAKLIYSGTVGTVPATKATSATALTVNGVVGNKLNLTVPAAGQYEISLYSLNGQKLGSVTSLLSAGVASVNLDGMNLGSRMAIVQINGAKAQSVHKVMIK